MLIVVKMWLRKNTVKDQDYYRIVHSVRKGKKVAQKTILSLGRLDERMATLIGNWLKGFPPGNEEYAITPLSEIKVKRQLSYGGEFIGKSIWDEFKLTELIDSTVKTRSDIGIKPGELSMIMTINRCVDPRSKLGIVEEWYPSSSLQFLCGITPDDLYTNRLYRAMDHLDKNKNKIEQKLWRKVKKRFGLSSDVILYDITSTYFESAEVDEKKKEKCKLRDHGYSRDHRSDKKQVNWGLVLTKEGFPITHEVYPGNTTDKTTPVVISKKLKEGFGVKECIFIGDRGMMTSENVKLIKKEEYRYIFAESLDDVKDIIIPRIEEIPEDVWGLGYPISKRLRNKYGIMEIDEDIICIEMKKEEDGEEVRYIICHNREKVEDDRNFREQMLDKGKKIMEKVRKTIKAGRLKDHDKVLKRIVKNLAKKNLDKYFGWKIPPTPVSDFEYWIRNEKVTKWGKLDGKWVLRTNIKAPSADSDSDELRMKVEEIVAMYKNLKIVERAFRTIKSFIKVRPVDHHLDVRIRAHIFMCVLAYLIEKTIEHKLKSSDVDMTAQRVFSLFRGMEVVDTMLGDDVPILVRRVTERNDVQKRILKCLGMSGIDRLNQSRYL